MRPLLLVVALAMAPAPLLAQFDSSADPGPSLGAGAQIDPQLGPYEALIPAPDQSDAALASALRSAMQSVIERQAGYGAAGTYEGDQLMSQARQYVLSYSFEVDAASTPPQTLLRARFDGNAVRSALARAGMITQRQTEAIEIEVSGIDDLADYQRVATHLRRLGSVRSAAPTAGNGDVVRFKLQVDPSITDQEEKQLAFEGIVSIGRGERGTLARGRRWGELWQRRRRGLVKVRIECERTLTLTRFA